MLHSRRHNDKFDFCTKGNPVDAKTKKPWKTKRHTHHNQQPQKQKYHRAPRRQLPAVSRQPSFSNFTRVKSQIGSLALNRHKWVEVGADSNNVQQGTPSCDHGEPGSRPSDKIIMCEPSPHFDGAVAHDGNPASSALGPWFGLSCYSKTGN